jgi:hypothetical protein
MRNLSLQIATRQSASMLALLALSLLVGFAAPASAAFVEYSGSNKVVGGDGVSRTVQLWMIFDDQFVKNPGTPPPVPGASLTGALGHFKIISYTVHVSGLGVFAGTNGRLNLWYQRTPAAFSYYTEELEVLEDHSLLKFQDGAGNPWGWAPWLASPPQYKLPPELMVPRLNISPDYWYDLGNEVHLFPVSRCGRTCLPLKLKRQP